MISLQLRSRGLASHTAKTSDSIMDPISLASLIEGSIGLALQCASAVKTLNSMVGQFQYAKIFIVSIKQDLEIIQLPWERISQWSEEFLPEDSRQRLMCSLESGRLVMDALEEGLAAYETDRFNFGQRSKSWWNGDILKAHQDRIHYQATSMSLLLQVLQL